MLGTTLGVFFFSGILLLAPSPVFAQGTGSASTQRLASEYQRLRADLDRVNAQVAALKQGGRGVRTDYLLRDKMAEAEALARKVTAAEARLRASRGPLPAETLVDTVQTPPATAQDGAVELEAKADLLSDQARRFRTEAEALARTAEQIRTRQALRRRAGAWDRDPLAGFEASKRIAIISSRTDSGGSSAAPRGSTSSDPGSKSGGTSDSAGASPAVPAAAPSTPTTAAVGGPSAVSSPSPSGTLSATSRPVASTDASSKTALQQRTLLDPATLAGIRSSLSQAGSLSDPDAVEAAAIALRKHARALEENARRLRARAGQQ
jgi:hypothetical protein